MFTISNRAGDATSRSRTLKTLIAAALAVAAILIMSQQGAEASDTEVCVGSQCDTVAFVDDTALFTLYQDLTPSSPVGRFLYGNPGDEPLMGDWNCNGEQTPGMYRRSTGLVYLRNSNTQGIADSQYIFGNPSDIPIVGDFNGDGCDTVSIYRPSEARFYLSFTLGARVADVSFYFGGLGDTPVIGDFDGDGVDSVGIYRPSNGFVALTDSHVGGPANRLFYFGGPGDRAIAGDWDGDGDDTVAIYRYSDGSLHINNENRSGSAGYTLQVGKYRRALAASGINNVQSGPPPGNGGGNGGGNPVPGFEPPPARPSSGPITISGRSNVVIENLHISNPGGTCVTVSNSTNVIIRNSTIGPCGGNAVYSTDSSNVTISGNYVTDTSVGVLAHRTDSIRVDGNLFADTGRNVVQFDKVNGPGSSISENRSTAQLGGTNAEDLISVFESNGTSSSPIRIVNNYLRNGGPSSSGSGIMLGDGGGSNQIAQGNYLVNPGQVGIGVAGGNNIKVLDNFVYSSAQSWSNVGIYAWNFGSGCGSVEIAGNQVDWKAAGGYSNGFWNGGGCSLSEYGNNWGADLGPGIW